MVLLRGQAAQRQVSSSEFGVADRPARFDPAGYSPLEMVNLLEIRPTVKETAQLAGPDPLPANENKGFVPVGHLIKRRQPGVKVVFVTFVEKSEKMAAFDDPCAGPFGWAADINQGRTASGQGDQLLVSQVPDNCPGWGVQQQIDHLVTFKTPRYFLQGPTAVSYCLDMALATWTR